MFGFEHHWSALPPGDSLTKLFILIGVWKALSTLVHEGLGLNVGHITA